MSRNYTTVTAEDGTPYQFTFGGDRFATMCVGDQVVPVPDPEAPGQGSFLDDAYPSNCGKAWAIVKNGHIVEIVPAIPETPNDAGDIASVRVTGDVHGQRELFRDKYAIDPPSVDLWSMDAWARKALREEGYRRSMERMRRSPLSRGEAADAMNEYTRAKMREDGFVASVFLRPLDPLNGLDRGEEDMRERRLRAAVVVATSCLIGDKKLHTRLDPVDPTLTVGYLVPSAALRVVTIRGVVGTKSAPPHFEVEVNDPGVERDRVWFKFTVRPLLPSYTIADAGSRLAAAVIALASDAVVGSVVAEGAAALRRIDGGHLADWVEVPTVKITVNAREHEVPADVPLTREAVAGLAGKPPEATVTYRVASHAADGTEIRVGGELAPRRKLAPVVGMVFNVQDTSNA